MYIVFPVNQTPKRSNSYVFVLCSFDHPCHPFPILSKKTHSKSQTPTKMLHSPRSTKQNRTERQSISGKKKKKQDKKTPNQDPSFLNFRKPLRKTKAEKRQLEAKQIMLPLLLLLLLPCVKTPVHQSLAFVNISHVPWTSQTTPKHSQGKKAITKRGSRRRRRR